MSHPQDVFITGIGLVTPLGIGLEEPWKALLAGKSAAHTIQQFDVSQAPVQIACELPSDFETSARMYYRKRSDYKKAVRFSHIAMAASHHALEDAGLDLSQEDTTRIGVIQGTGAGALLFTEHQIQNYYDPNKSQDLLSIVKMMPNVGSATISIGHQILGPSLSVTTACASGIHAIGLAFDWIQQGKVDLAIAGGVDTPISSVALQSFYNIGALSQRNDAPQKASRPFDKDRDGFVMSEGGGIVILESRQHLEKRSHVPHAQVLGWGCNSDGYSLAMPKQSGEGVAAAIQLALQQSQTQPEQVGHINAHGTSTAFNDLCETRAIKQVFGSHAASLNITACKSMLGHSIGGSGGIETAVTALTLKHQQTPPTLNLDTPDEECDLDYTPHVAKNIHADIAMCNSFGFGGHNACIVLKQQL